MSDNVCVNDVFKEKIKKKKERVVKKNKEQYAKAVNILNKTKQIIRNFCCCCCIFIFYYIEIKFVHVSKIKFDKVLNIFLM